MNKEAIEYYKKARKELRETESWLEKRIDHILRNVFAKAFPEGSYKLDYYSFGCKRCGSEVYSALKSYTPGYVDVTLYAWDPDQTYISEVMRHYSSGFPEKWLFTDDEKIIECIRKELESAKIKELEQEAQAKFKEDAKRKSREKALSKLSEEEKKALGL